MADLRFERTMMISSRLIASVLAASAIAFAAPVHAQSFSDGQKDEIRGVIREYLLSRPEILEEAMAELQKRQQAAEKERSVAAVKANGNVIFNSPRNVVVGNTKGDV